MDGQDSVLAGVTDLLESFEVEDATLGDFDDIAHRLHLATQLQERVGDVVAALKLQLHDVMPSNATELPVEGVGIVRRTRSKRSSWRDQQASKAMREDIAVAVARAVSVDQFTGSISEERRQAAYAAVRNVWDVIPAPSDMKVSAQSYGLDKEDYRMTSWVESVEVIPFPTGLGVVRDD